jgi:hypothetical protein
MCQPNVRHAIESHLLDSSPAVRDAAVDLIGKYMIDSPTVAGDYFPKIAERIAVGIFFLLMQGLLITLSNRILDSAFASGLSSY